MWNRHCQQRQHQICFGSLQEKCSGHWYVRIYGWFAECMGVKLVGGILFYCNLYDLTLMPVLVQAVASLGVIFSVKWFFFSYRHSCNQLWYFWHSSGVYNFYANHHTESLAANPIACPGSVGRNFVDAICTIHWFNAVAVAIASDPVDLMVLTSHQLNALSIVSRGGGRPCQELVKRGSEQCKSYFWIQA